MHQQVRTSTTKTGSGSPGPGAMADEGSLVDVLRILGDNGVNLRSAGGRDLDRGGEFVFSVHHEDGDDASDEKVAALLRDHGYGSARAVAAHSCSVADEPGGLLGCIEEVQASDGPVYEIFVGTPEADDSIPVQLTTRASAGGKSAD
jgi:hypothetical protein